MTRFTAAACMTGSFCTFQKAFDAWRELKNAGADLLPIMSPAAFSTDTRFFTASDARSIFESIAGKPILTTIAQAEPIGPKNLSDITIVAPCTGNTLSKIANGVADTAVSMAVKSTLRNGRPVLLAVSSNDLLGVGARNLGALMSMRNIYFVPFGQDDPLNKPTSLVAKFPLLKEAALAALNGKQLQPMLQ